MSKRNSNPTENSYLFNCGLIDYLQLTSCIEEISHSSTSTQYSFLPKIVSSKLCRDLRQLRSHSPGQFNQAIRLLFYELNSGSVITNIEYASGLSQLLPDAYSLHAGLYPLPFLRTLCLPLDAITHPGNGLRRALTTIVALSSCTVFYNNQTVKLAAGDCILLPNNARNYTKIKSGISSAFSPTMVYVVHYYQHTDGIAI